MFLLCNLPTFAVQISLSSRSLFQSVPLSLILVPGCCVFLQFVCIYMCKVCKLKAFLLAQFFPYCFYFKFYFQVFSTKIFHRNYANSYESVRFFSPIQNLKNVNFVIQMKLRAILRSNEPAYWVGM